MKGTSRLAWAVPVTLLCALPLLAHHSFSAEFDAGTTVTLRGVVSKVEWINPHIYIYFDVVDPKDGSKSQYAVETFPPNHMRSRYGLTKQLLSTAFDKKETLTIEVNPAKNAC